MIYMLVWVFYITKNSSFCPPHTHSIAAPCCNKDCVITSFSMNHSNEPAA